ncbi:MAG: SixA phosphatase family protein [Anaerolineae bacterium]
MSKTLFILRHAKSSWADTSLADHDRPLKGRGQRDAPRMGAFMRKHDLLPDYILCSTAKRARQTIKLVIEVSQYEGHVKLTPHLYHAEPETIVEVLHNVPDDYERVMIVGHNPGLEMLVESLTDEWESLPTTALAQIALPIDRWEALSEDTEGTLVGLWTPREL